MSDMLVVEQDEQVLSTILDYATNDGFTVYTATSIADGTSEFYKRNYDVLVLADLKIQYGGIEYSGFDICTEIRKISAVPILYLSEKDDELDKVRILDLGADDYIIKPFSPLELMARVRAVIRRYKNISKWECKIENLYVSIEKYEVTIDEEKVPLTKKEIEILWLFVSNVGKVFKRENIINSIWGYDYSGDSRTIDAHIMRLRSKLDKFSHENWAINTVWGLGYKFEVADGVSS